MTVEYLTWVRNQRESGEIEVETVREGTFDPVGYTTLQADSHSVYRSAKFRDAMQRRLRHEASILTPVRPEP